MPPKRRRDEDSSSGTDDDILNINSPDLGPNYRGHSNPFQNDVAAPFLVQQFMNSNTDPFAQHPQWGASPQLEIVFHTPKLGPSIDFRDLPPTLDPQPAPTGTSSPATILISERSSDVMSDEDNHFLTESEGIQTWTHSDEARPFKSSRMVSLLDALNNCRLKSKAKGVTNGKEARLALTRPSCDPSRSGMIAVATSNRDCTTHLVMIVDTNQLDGSDIDNDALIVSAAHCPKHIQELHWIADNRLAVTHGTGNIVLYSINANNDLSPNPTELLRIHRDEIREMCFTNDGRFVAGGFDCMLSINDITVPGCTTSAVRINDVIGSVAWGTFDSNSVSATTDDGRFFQFDIRSNMKKASMYIDTQKLQLYTHCMLDPNHILLGFGDGSILQVDTRMDGRGFIAGTEDRYVSAIGDIIYNKKMKSLLVSGQSDFSLWECDANKATADCISHGDLPVPSVSGAFAVNAVFGGPERIITTDELGYIGLYNLH